MLELGGKSPAIVFEDADLEAAAQATQFSVQINSGQTCMANSRVYVQDTVADKFIDLFKEKFGPVKAGDPTLKDTNHGPQADKLQYENVLKYLEIGKKEWEAYNGRQPRLRREWILHPPNGFYRFAGRLADDDRGSIWSSRQH